MLTTKAVKQQYDEGMGVQVVFYDNGIEVGKACTVEYEEKPNAFLHGFVVKEHLRNKGYGTQILKYMIETYNVETLHVEKGSKAINLYHRFGFEPIGMFGNNMIIMKRRITMQKCENCIHCDVCDRTSRQIYANIAEGGICRDYKDKSLIYEMPCKEIYKNLGGSLYCITDETDEVIEVIAGVIEIDCEGREWIETAAIDYDYETEDGISNYIDFRFADFGKTLFLTREEAEKALREREENDKT